MSKPPRHISTLLNAKDEAYLRVDSVHRVIQARGLKIED